jgi:FRG domain
MLVADSPYSIPCRLDAGDSEDSCGMAALWKPQDGFQRNLRHAAQNATFPQANLRLIEEREKRKNKKNKKAKDRDRSTTRCLDRPAVMAGFAVLVNGRFSDVHRGELETWALMQHHGAPTRLLD